MHINFNIMKQTEDKFRLYRESLKQELIYLASFVLTYKSLYKRHEDRLEEMNMFQAFFQVSLHSLFSCIVLWVHKLYDENSERGIYNFLSFVENNLKIFHIKELQRTLELPDDDPLLKRDPVSFKMIKSDRNKIGEQDSLKNFKLLRDKYYAHLDKEHFYEIDDLLKTTQITWGDLDSILELSNEILNKYSSSFDGHIYTIEPWNVDDINDLLDFIHKHKNQ